MADSSEPYVCGSEDLDKVKEYHDYLFTNAYHIGRVNDMNVPYSIIAKSMFPGIALKSYEELGVTPPLDDSWKVLTMEYEKILQPGEMEMFIDTDRRDYLHSVRTEPPLTISIFANCRTVVQPFLSEEGIEFLTPIFVRCLLVSFKMIVHGDATVSPTKVILTYSIRRDTYTSREYWNEGRYDEALNIESGNRGYYPVPVNDGSTLYFDINQVYSDGKRAPLTKRCVK